jgi:membrane-associated phospholipid phosphatase
MAATEERKHWLYAAVVRWRARPLLNAAGITAYITLFMVAYFTLLRHPAFPVTMMPLTDLDRWIPFTPWSMVLYASLWLYISLVPALLTWRELPPYLAAVTLLSLAGFTLFFFWPTAVPRPDIDWSQYPSVAFLKAVDASGNACPSLHVAFAVLSALWLQRLLQQLRAPHAAQALSALWCLGILWSTLATKQHVALDLYAGAALGLAVALPFLLLYPEPRSLPAGAA